MKKKKKEVEEKVGEESIPPTVADTFRSRYDQFYGASVRYGRYPSKTETYDGGTSEGEIDWLKLGILEEEAIYQSEKHIFGSLYVKAEERNADDDGWMAPGTEG